MRQLPRPFFAADAPTVAPALLNKLLVVRGCSGRISEVEAYTADDPASHSHRGPTPRNAVMFGPAGFLYAYFTYGMHHCANVVTGRDGDGQAVLIRAVLPVSGAPLMITRRGRTDHVADGPGKLCQALAIGMTDNGLDLCANGAEIGVYDDGVEPPDDPAVSMRIGIRVGVERLWRWSLPSTAMR